MKSLKTLSRALTAGLLLAGGVTTQAAETPKNIIVFISDGWGYNHVAATKYWHGTDKNSYEAFSVYYPMSTYCSKVESSSENKLEAYTNAYNSYKAWTDWKWLKRESDGGDGASGSGAAATAMASGKKTSKLSIGMDADSVALELIAERAIALGKRAGVVSSVEFSHATPAGFSAHNGNRNDYINIARQQILDSKMSVIMGCGNPMYTADGELKDAADFSYKYVGGEEIWKGLVDGSSEFSVAAPSGNNTVQDIDGDGTPDTWTLIQDSADFEKYSHGDAPNRLIGIPKVYKTLQHDRSGEYRNTDPFAVPYTEGVPRLYQMTNAAINVLNSHNGGEGFFLMVEGGAVDWAGHGNSLARIIEEQTDFNMAVDSAVAWLKANGELENTLIIVTGDHETGYLTGADFDTLDMVNTYAIENAGKGVMPAHAFMSNNVYGQDNYGEHTNQLIPFYAQGPGADMFHNYADRQDFVRGEYIDNTDVAHVMFDLWPVDTKPEPKNIVLMISDGWGYNQVNATEYFRGTPAVYKSFDTQYAMATYPSMTGEVWKNDNVSNYNTWYQSYGAWSNYDFINHGYTGSAPAATAMYAGKKTAKYAIGVGIDSTELLSFGERGFDAGKSVGIVSSVQFSHATPASMLAHNINRNNYAQIANEILIDSRAAVVMGAGAPDFGGNGNALHDTLKMYDYVGGQGTWNNLLEGATVFDSLSINNNNTVQDMDGDGGPDAWTMVRDSADVVALASGETPKRVVCIPKVGATLQQNREGNADTAYATPQNTNVPKLADMARAALNVLDNNQNGFSLMIEGGAVDWAGHANQAGYLIEEQDDFDNSVQAVVDWVEQNSDWDETLLIVTGDHETGYFVGDNFDKQKPMETYAVKDNGTGYMPGCKFMSGGHTNQLIPFYAKGEGEELFDDYADHDDFVRGKYLENTAIAEAIFKMWADLPADKPDFPSEAEPPVETQLDLSSTEGVSVAPTVAGETVKLSTAGIASIYKIVGQDGTVLLTGTTAGVDTELSLAGLAEGVYFLQVYTQEGGHVVLSIVKH